MPPQPTPLEEQENTNSQEWPPQSNYDDANVHSRPIPQPSAALTSEKFSRPAFNPQFQRTAHSSSQTSMSKPVMAPVNSGPLGYVPQTAPAHTQAVSSRIASTNAAIAAFQSVSPPIIQEVPRNRPLMALQGFPSLPGGDLRGTINFDHAKGVQVIDEVTAQKSASEYSKFLRRVRIRRNRQWAAFWKYRGNLNRRILLDENKSFKEAQQDADDFEDSDEEDAPKRLKPVYVPYIYNNVGSLDVPRPPSVIMPEPEMIALRMQAKRNSSAYQPHTQQSQQAEQVLQAQQIQALQQKQISTRQRAAIQVKQYPRGF